MTAPRRSHLSSPEEASRAFYDAFERGDVTAMMEVWADDDETFCIHPGGARNVGPEAVRASWEEIFASPARLRFQLEQQLFFVGASIAVQSVFEYLQVNVEKKLRGPAVATNIYTRTPTGWRMLAHHAAPTPTAAAAPASTPRAGSLH
jgi:ketosteroid isomerase-like protein